MLVVGSVVESGSVIILGIFADFQISHFQNKLKSINLSLLLVVMLMGWVIISPEGEELNLAILLQLQVEWDLGECGKMFPFALRKFSKRKKITF